MEEESLKAVRLTAEAGGDRRRKKIAPAMNEKQKNQKIKSRILFRKSLCLIIYNKSI